MAGALQGLRVVELAGLGPASFAAMLLADMGAEVVRIARPGHVEMEKGATVRSRILVTLDLRSSEGQAQALSLIEHADVLIEGFRPGVTERMGLGPDVALKRNRRLVYGRMTGWGQTGVRSKTAGHDIDYIAITGALNAIGNEDPAVPLNLIGDYGGGGLYLAMGILAAVIHARASGQGQVIDAAIVDGTVSLLSLMHGLRHVRKWNDSRTSNVLDGAAPYYRTYRCKDGKHMAVGAIEPPFFKEFLAVLEVDDPLFAEQNNRAFWAKQTAFLQSVFGMRTQAEWATKFAGTDACVAPVRTLSESLDDEHLRERDAFIDLAGEKQPAPAPRFSVTPSSARESRNTDNLQQLLAEWSVNGMETGASSDRGSIRPAIS